MRSPWSPELGAPEMSPVWLMCLPIVVGPQLLLAVRIGSEDWLLTKVD